MYTSTCSSYIIIPMEKFLKEAQDPNKQNSTSFDFSKTWSSISRSVANILTT